MRHCALRPLIFTAIAVIPLLSAHAVAASKAGQPPAKPSTVAASATTGTSNLKTQSYAIGQNLISKMGAVAKMMDPAKLDAALKAHLAGKDPGVSPQRAEEIYSIVAQHKDSTALPAGVTADELAAMFAGFMVGPSLNAIKNDVDLDEVFRGIRTTMAGKPELNDAQLRTQLAAFNEAYQQAAATRAAQLAETNKAEGAAFLAKNKTAPGVKTTASGLQYIVLREGDGTRPTPTQKVRVHYEGRLLNGTVFDSSYKRNKPTEFGLNQVIKGWTEGLGLMPAGSKYRFFIPSELAYGATPRPGSPIGPNAVLVFDVELLNVLPN